MRRETALNELSSHWFRCDTILDWEHLKFSNTIKYGMFRDVLLLLVAITGLLPLTVAQSNSPASSQNPNVEAKNTSSWEIAAKERREELIGTNGPGTDVALRDQLLKMGEQDQA